MKDYDLEPLTCPFCGSEATVMWRGGKYGRFAVVQCDLCGAESKKYGNVVGPTDDDGFWTQDAFLKAIKAWNRRV